MADPDFLPRVKPSSPSLISPHWNYGPSAFLLECFQYLETKSTFLSSLYILDISPLSDLEQVKILSQSVGGLVVFLTVSFALQELCNFMRSHLSILHLTAQAIAVLFRNFPLCPYLRIFSPLSPQKFQCLWFYVEFLDPLRFDLSTRRQKWINSHSST